jgi:N-acyl homoserine lactone hydrolase
MANYKIHPIVVGAKLNEKGMITYQHDYGKEICMPIYSWYLEGADQIILVDTGEISPLNTEHRERLLGGKIYTIEDGLAKWGLSPKDIDIVIHTHLHSDHCENDYKFTNATFYVHELELEHLHNAHPLDYRYLVDYLEDIIEKGMIKAVKGGEEIVPGIQLIHTPAHTAGGLSVAIQTARGKAIITGCCTLMENYYPPSQKTAMGLEVIPPGTNTSPYEAYDTLLRLKNMADILIPIHDPQFVTVNTIPGE